MVASAASGVAVLSHTGTCVYSCGLLSTNSSDEVTFLVIFLFSGGGRGNHLVGKITIYALHRSKTGLCLWGFLIKQKVSEGRGESSTLG